MKEFSKTGCFFRKKCYHTCDSGKPYHLHTQNVSKSTYERPYNYGKDVIPILPLDKLSAGAQAVLTAHQVDPAGLDMCLRLDLDMNGDYGEVWLAFSRKDGNLYRVTVGSAATPEQIARLRAPMTIDGYRLQRVGLKIVRAEESRTVFEMTLHEGRNRQIRRMCETVGLEVVRLRRVAIGKLRIGSLRPGESKSLTDEQLAYLCEHTGMTAEG